MSMKQLLVVRLALLCTLRALCNGFPAVSALDNGLALTPPMGWLSWERYMCNTDCKNNPDSCISEQLYMAMADELVEGGFRDAGYVYVNIDDCWQNRTRDADGKLQADSQRFPHGIKWLSEYMHTRGLKLGIYTDYGSATCEGYPGTDWSHQEIDAKTFAEWGVDSVKVDGCNSNSSTMNDAYPRFGDFLNQTGRPMLYSCSWPDYLNDHVNFSYVGEKCNLWRMYRDIYSQWPIIEQIIEFYGDKAEVLQPIAGPGQWNDADQLTVGDHHAQGWCHNSSDPLGGCNGLSPIESETMMSFWAMFASPMLMSNDLRSIQPWAKDILLNKEVIAISQDSLGVQAVKLVDNTTMGNMTVKECTGISASTCTARTVAMYPVGGTEVWAKPLSNGDVAVLLYNKCQQVGQSMDINVALSAVGEFNSSYWGTKQSLFNATYKELYNHSSRNCSALGGSVCYSDIDIVGEDIPPHGSRLFRLTAAPSLWIPNTGTAAKSIVLNSSGFYPGNEPWKLVDGVLLFDCGKYGWDGSLSPGMPPGQYWVTFDLGTTIAIDAFALWNDGRGGWDVRNFAIQIGASPTGGDGVWQHVANATNLVAKTSYGGLQVFEGFQAASRYWRWYITGTGGNQPWVKEVQFRKQEKNHALEDVEQR